MNTPAPHRKQNDSQVRIESLLRQALPPVADPEAGPGRDLWPQILAHMEERQVVPWFDWVMLASLSAVLVFFPASVPVLLYYL